jgi:hypothetical protein
MQYQAAIGAVEPRLNNAYAMVFTGAIGFLPFWFRANLPSGHSRITAL